MTAEREQQIRQEVQECYQHIRTCGNVLERLLKGLSDNKAPKQSRFEREKDKYKSRILKRKKA